MSRVGLDRIGSGYIQISRIRSGQEVFKSRGSGQELFKSHGSVRVGSCQYLFQISRIGSGGVKN